MKLNQHVKYLQIALNKSLEHARAVIDALPPSGQIILEAGTPLIKQYGNQAIRALKQAWQLKVGNQAYIVADFKCMDRGFTEVDFSQRAGADAATCLGLAPLETINEFIRECQEIKIDSIIDMMNVEFPFEILKDLKSKPDMVMLHRGVDERLGDKHKPLPLLELHRIKASYSLPIAVAGGENSREAQRAYFNDADIVVVWEPFYNDPRMARELAEEFLKLAK